MAIEAEKKDNLQLHDVNFIEQTAAADLCISVYGRRSSLSDEAAFFPSYRCKDRGNWDETQFLVTKDNYENKEGTKRILLRYARFKNTCFPKENGRYLYLNMCRICLLIVSVNSTTQ